MGREHIKGGFNPNAGRPLGSRNKLQGDLLKALAADFAEHGPGVIRIARIEKPIEYLKCCIAVLPKELIVDGGILADMSDEDIAASLSLLQRLQLNKHKQEPDQPVQLDETKH